MNAEKPSKAMEILDSIAKTFVGCEPADFWRPAGRRVILDILLTADWVELDESGKIALPNDTEGYKVRMVETRQIIKRGFSTRLEARTWTMEQLQNGVLEGCFLQEVEIIGPS